MSTDFIKLSKLVDITYEGETAEERTRWLENCKVSGVADNGFAVAMTCTDDVDITRLDYTELEQDDNAIIFDFAGSQFEDERFYARDDAVYRHKQTGVYYTEYTDKLFEF